MDLKSSVGRQFLKLSIVSILLFTGCVSTKGYRINYALNKSDIVVSNSYIPMKVVVEEFLDRREGIEKEKSARKEKSFRDLNDYTYDWQFQGKVSEEITKMLIEHLNYSKVFQPLVTLLPSGSTFTLEYLAKQGINAVLSGEIENFYGYYDQKQGRRLLYHIPLSLGSLVLSLRLTKGFLWTTIPGIYLGNYLESLHGRQIEYHVRITARLTSTKTHNILWEDSFDVSFVGKKKRMPGFLTEKRKFEVTINALRDAVNKMVESLAKAKFPIEN